MAQAVNYFPSQNVEVYYQKETASGNQPDDAGLTKLQTTSFTIPEASVPLEMSAQRAGTFNILEGQGHHAEGSKVWTFDTVLRGSPASVLLATEAVFEDASSEAVLNNDYMFPTAGYVNNTGSATFDIRFINAGSDATLHNVVCGGCVGTGFTLAEDIGSEGGELVCTINWATAYKPYYSADDVGSPAYDVGTPKNIRSLASASCTIDAGNEVVIKNWNLAVTRTIERIHFKDQTSTSTGANTTGFAPFGYAMVGGFSVSGSMTVIRNDDVHDLLENFYDSSTVDINIAESSGFAIALDKCYLAEPSVDSGGAVLHETIPFTVVGDANLASTVKMLGITIA